VRAPSTAAAALRSDASTWAAYKQSKTKQARVGAAKLFAFGVGSASALTVIVGAPVLGITPDGAKTIFAAGLLFDALALASSLRARWRRFARAQAQAEAIDEMQAVSLGLDAAAHPGFANAAPARFGAGFFKSLFTRRTLGWLKIGAMLTFNNALRFSRPAFVSPAVLTDLSQSPNTYRWLPSDRAGALSGIRAELAARSQARASGIGEARLVFVADLPADELGALKDAAGLNAGDPNIQLVSARGVENAWQLFKTVYPNVSDAEIVHAVTARTNRFSVPVGVDVPTDFFRVDQFPLDPASRSALQRSFDVIFILNELMAIRVAPTQLDLFETWRTILLQA
jgi:hypothetical protein